MAWACCSRYASLGSTCRQAAGGLRQQLPRCGQDSMTPVLCCSEHTQGQALSLPGPGIIAGLRATRGDVHSSAEARCTCICSRAAPASVAAASSGAGCPPGEISGASLVSVARLTGSTSQGAAAWGRSRLQWGMQGLPAHPLRVSCALP